LLNILVLYGTKILIFNKKQCVSWKEYIFYRKKKKFTSLLWCQIYFVAS